MSSTFPISSHVPRYHKIYKNEFTAGGYAVTCQGCNYKSPLLSHQEVAEGVFEVHLKRMKREQRREAWLSFKLIPPNWHLSWHGVLHVEIALRHRMQYMEQPRSNISMMCGRHIQREHIMPQGPAKQICQRCLYKFQRWTIFQGLAVDPTIQLSYLVDADAVERKLLPRERLIKATDRMKNQYTREKILRQRVVELETTTRQLNEYIKIQFDDKSVVLKTLLDGSEITIPKPYVTEHRHIWSDTTFPTCVLCSKLKHTVERESSSQSGTDST